MPADSLSHWHILGAGAIGGLWALRLHAIGCPVTLLDPRPAAPRRTICLQADGRRYCHEFACRPAMAPLSPLLVTTKAASSKGALTPLLQLLSPGDIVVLLQNGMGVDEWLQAERPDLCVVTGITTDGVFRESRDELVMAGQGTTRLGGETPASQRVAASIAQQWATTGADVSATPDIRAERWMKLAINCAINPLTALYRCRNGELASHPDALSTMAEVCREIAAVMRAERIDTSADALYERALDVARRTAANTSSMLADVLAGMPTEVDFMNGHVVAVAARHGIAAPTNARLLAAIHALDPARLST